MKPAAWINELATWRQSWRSDYLPPLLVYLAFGVQGLTGIVGTFYVKERLGLSAEFLAALGFWTVLPFALKLPIGHLVDVLWRFKGVLLWLGALLLAASLLIMAQLIGQPQQMAQIMSVNAWFVLASLLLPLGFVLQDAVADAMTVEAVPQHDADGRAYSEAELKRLHTTMQTLGRVAVIGGSVLVSLVNLWLFSDSHQLDSAQKTALYQRVYLLALVIPLLSVSGLLWHGWLQRQRKVADDASGTAPNAWLLGGSLLFVAFTVLTGLSDMALAQEIVFAGSLAIVLGLMLRLMRELTPQARRTLLGTALVIFLFRAAPGPGAGVSWWTIDVLGFDAEFMARLALLSSTLTLIGMFAFRRLMAERPVFVVIAFLTIAQTLISLPTLGMSYGLHLWTAQHTGGLIDARAIALIDTALDSPLGQVAMIPMLAWIAHSAPSQLKATYFAVMASFTNLALSASQLGSKYLNQVFVIAREVRDPVSGNVLASADYSALSPLLWSSLALGVLLPGAALLIAWRCRWQSA